MTRSKVRDDRHMAHLHHKVGCDGSQQLRAEGCLYGAILQAYSDQMGAVAVNHTRGLGRQALRGAVNALVQCQCFAGPGPTALLALQIEPSEVVGIEKTQAGIGRRDEKTIVQAHADVACGGMHIAAIKQALPDATHGFTRLGQLGMKMKFRHEGKAQAST